MTVLGSSSWAEAIAGESPLKTLAALVALVLVAAGAGAALRAVSRRIGSLRVQVLAITLGALVIGATVALLLSWLMVLDAGELETVLGVLTLTAVLAVVLVVVSSAPLGHDATRLASTVRRIEAGDRAVRVGIARRDELGRVAHALDELTARLGELESERERFEAERSAMLSSVSHDLRTPLAALRAAVEALADGVAPDPDRYLRSMQHDVEALSALVDDLFLLVRLENGRYELQVAPVDLTEVADEAIEALAPVAAERGVHLALDAPTRVRADGSAAALGRVIRNLVDNAIHHAPAGSTVTVAVDGAGSPTVRITDEGPGFPADFVAEAFDHFTRADPSRTRGTGGAGLGLAIAQGLVQAHGGRIWIDEAPGGRVAFELPTELASCEPRRSAWGALTGAGAGAGAVISASRSRG